MSADPSTLLGLARAKRVLLRTSVTVMVLFFVFLAPWWLSYSLILSCIVFAAMYEMLILGVILESIYVAGTFMGDGGYPFTAIALCVSGCAWYVRRRLLLGEVLP